MPKTNEEAEVAEPEIPEPAVTRRPARGGAAMADGHRETRSHAVAEPVLPPEEFDVDEGDENELLDNGLEQVLNNPVVEDTDIPDMDLGTPEEDEEDFFDDEVDEDEEDDSGWGAGGRGRKKNKPTRQAKLPPKKPNKRDTRRSGF